MPRSFHDHRNSTTPISSPSISDLGYVDDDYDVAAAPGGGGGGGGVAAVVGHDGPVHGATASSCHGHTQADHPVRLCSMRFQSFRVSHPTTLRVLAQPLFDADFSYLRRKCRQEYRRRELLLIDPVLRPSSSFLAKKWR